MPRSTVAACCLLVATFAHADSWPWYGGPNHTGVIADSDALPDGENIKVLWKVRMLGTGHSGPAVVGDEVFILDRRGAKEAGEDYLRVFDLGTGKQLWSFAYAAPGDCRQQSIGYMPHRAGPVSVPAVSDARVFVTGARGRLYCIDRQTRDLVWSKQLNAPITHEAFSPSPLFVGDLVIVSYTSEHGDVLQALRIVDGEVAWTVQPELRREQEHGMVAVVHASPILVTIFGEQHVVATHKRVTFGADPKTGKVLWQYEGYRRGSIQAEVAISPDGYMFFTSGHDGTSSLVHMTRDDAGYHFDVVYYDPQKDRAKTRACSEWRRGHWWDGHLYHVSNHFASHGLLCMDKQGEVLWKTQVKDRNKRGPNFRYSCLTIVGGIGLALDGGNLKVIRLNPQAYEELGSIEVFKLGEAVPPIERPEDWNDRKWAGYLRRLALSTWAKHAYVDGMFLTRNPQYLSCVRVGTR
jgi:hypothetical protein